MKKLLVCFDGSTESMRAVTYAKEHARLLDEIVVFTAWEPLHDPRSGSVEAEAAAADATQFVYVPPHDEWMQNEAKRRRNVAHAHAARAKAFLVAAGFAAVSTVCVEAADVRAAIVAAIQREHADTVVVGTRSHGLLAGAALGSVSLHLALHAPCSVTIARAASQQ
jgi:nucleotide-binding universal stress UspA family protein